jgi:hypothetical protein
MLAARLPIILYAIPGCENNIIDLKCTVLSQAKKYRIAVLMKMLI